MIEKPDIPEDRLFSTVRGRYSIAAQSIEFLPRGWDSAAWSYRVTTPDRAYFLKVRREISNPASTLMPGFLRDQGIQQVIAPLSTTDGQAWAPMDGYQCILYPFVAAEQVRDVGMSDAHWVEFGSFLRHLHTAAPSIELQRTLRREDFVPQRMEWVRQMHSQLKAEMPADLLQRELAEFWLANHSTIGMILERTNMLAEQLKQRANERVLCHGDIHTSNVLRSEDNRIFIVDWDDCLLAPRERDLMFVMDGSGSRETELFFEGYGRTEIDPLTLAYYRYDWCVEDMGGFAEGVFTGENVGRKTRESSVWWFKRLFEPGDSIQSALGTQLEALRAAGGLQ